jgi:hypothetical protein
MGYKILDWMHDIRGDTSRSVRHSEGARSKMRREKKREVIPKSPSVLRETKPKIRRENKRQKNVILIGIILIVAMGLFPPWVYEYYGTISQEYRFILDPLKDGKIDLLRLLVQWLGVCIVSVGLVWFYRD